MSDRFPGPINSDKAESAEARRRELKSRFRAVSRRIDGKGRFSGGMPGGKKGSRRLTPFEIALGVAGLAFILWAVGHLVGGV